jgi:hypothetical protein
MLYIECKVRIPIKDVKFATQDEAVVALINRLRLKRSWFVVPNDRKVVDENGD